MGHKNASEYYKRTQKYIGEFQVKADDVAPCDAAVTHLAVDVMFVIHMLTYHSNTVEHYMERLRRTVISWKVQHPWLRSLHVLCDSPIHRMRAKELESASRREASIKAGILPFTPGEKARGIYSPLASPEQHAEALEALQFHPVVMRNGKRAAEVYWSRLIVTSDYYFQLKLMVMDEIRRMLVTENIVREAVLYNLLVSDDRGDAHDSSSVRSEYREVTLEIKRENDDAEPTLTPLPRPTVLYESDGIFADVLNTIFEDWRQRAEDANVRYPQVVRVRTVDTDGMDTALLVGARWLPRIVEAAARHSYSALAFEIDTTPGFTWHADAEAGVAVEADGTEVMQPSEAMQKKVTRRVFDVWEGVRKAERTDHTQSEDAVNGALNLVTYSMLVGTDYVPSMPLLGPAAIFEAWAELGPAIGDLAIFVENPPAGASHYALRAEALRQFIRLMYMRALPKETRARGEYTRLLTLFKRGWLEVSEIRNHPEVPEYKRKFTTMLDSHIDNPDPENARALRAYVVQHIHTMDAMRTEQNERIRKWNEAHAAWTAENERLTNDLESKTADKMEALANKANMEGGFETEWAVKKVEEAEAALKKHAKKEKKKAPPVLPTDDAIEATLRIVAFCLGYFGENFVPADSGYTQDTSVSIGFAPDAAGNLAVATGLKPLSSAGSAASMLVVDSQKPPN